MPEEKKKEKEPLDVRSLLARGEYRVVTQIRNLGMGQIWRIDDWLNSMRGAKTVCHRTKVTVYFPVATPEAETVADELRGKMTRIFGGTTAWRGRGTDCANDDCSVINDEPVMVIQSYHSCTTEERRKQFAEALKEAEEKTKQKWVGIAGTDTFFAIPIERYRVK